MAASGPSGSSYSEMQHHEDGVDYGDDDDNSHEMTEEDKELEAMKARVREMEAEAAKLREMQAQAEKEMAAAQQGSSTSRAGSANGATPGPSTGEDGASSSAGTPSQAAMTDEEKEATDARSIYVGNVDYGATPEEIQEHFASCGTINRVTILCDKFTGHPKGYAYVEFADPSLVANSMTLNESLFRGRLIKVTPKRTNVPAFMLPGSRGRGGRGRPYRGGRGGFRGGYNPYGYSPRGRGRGRGAMHT